MQERDKGEWAEGRKAGTGQEGRANFRPIVEGRKEGRCRRNEGRKRKERRQGSYDRKEGES